MNELTKILKNWTLPIGMACGLLGFLAFHYVHWLAPLKPAAAEASSALMPTVLFVMLFATFCKVDPRLMRVTPWHAWLVAFQLLSCLAIALILHFAPASGHALLPEGLMICLVCPTAGAAAVITGKLGGSETTLTTYTILSNLAAAIIIPLVFPLVESRADAPFLSQFLTILRRVFPLLICPFLLAWGLREFFPKAHARVVAGCRDLAFYLWGFGLVLSVGQTCRFLADSPVGAHIKWLLSVASLAACALQFALGKGIGARYGERIGGGAGAGAEEHHLRHLGVVHLPLAGARRGSRHLHNMAEPVQLVAAVAQAEARREAKRSPQAQPRGRGGKDKIG